MTDSNPWLTIPATDYEGHMRLVGQETALRNIFGKVYADVRPPALGLLGCTTGNGLDVVDPRITSYCAAIDINPDYLELVRRRFPNPGFVLDIRCGDVAAMDLPAARLDLVHAALLLEYVEPAPLFQRIRSWLAPRGICSIVLQRPSGDQAMITSSPYPSLECLGKIMRLHDPDAVRRLARAAGLEERSTWEVQVPGGKRLHIAVFRNQ